MYIYVIYAHYIISGRAHISVCKCIYIYTAVPTDMAHSVGGCFMHPWGFGFKLVVTPLILWDRVGGVWPPVGESTPPEGG